MILCIDCGNTRLKWGLCEGAAWLAQGALPLAEAESLDEVLPRRPSRVVACNVAGPSLAQAVVLAADRLGAPLSWVHAHAEQCGVTNGYEHPAQLGADRWAALIGARALHGGACLVVMSGTATTVDVLDGDGMFRGGLILPGLAMMQNALAAGTAGLPTAAGAYRELPGNTADAIASGCLNATLGAIERMFRRVEKPGALCLLSGGAAPALSPRLPLPHRVVDNLVLEGLARYSACQ
ncbi:MAG: type III pantothenate kinase [Rhodocyclaceae bacterium]|nr:type III pantothenate kinase [Rhodocyclaceae bacterium]